MCSFMGLKIPQKSQRRFKQFLNIIPFLLCGAVAIEPLVPCRIAAQELHARSLFTALAAAFIPVASSLPMALLLANVLMDKTSMIGVLAAPWGPPAVDGLIAATLGLATVMASSAVGIWLVCLLPWRQLRVSALPPSAGAAQMPATRPALRVLLPDSTSPEPPDQVSVCYCPHSNSVSCEVLCSRWLRGGVMMSALCSLKGATSNAKGAASILTSDRGGVVTPCWSAGDHRPAAADVDGGSRGGLAATAPLQRGGAQEGAVAARVPAGRLRGAGPRGRAPCDRRLRREPCGAPAGPRRPQPPASVLQGLAGGPSPQPLMRALL